MRYWGTTRPAISDSRRPSTRIRLSNKHDLFFVERIKDLAHDYEYGDEGYVELVVPKLHNPVQFQFVDDL